MPDDLPEQKFQLIVVSEILYYFEEIPIALQQVLTSLRTALKRAVYLELSLARANLGI